MPYIHAYPQQIVHLTIVNQTPVPVGLLGVSVAGWPWWFWLLIGLPLLLLLCLIPLLFFLCARRRKVADTESIKKQKMKTAKQTQTVTTTTSSKRLRETANDETSREPTVRDHSAHHDQTIYRTPSESPSGSVQSTTSHSRSALVVKQKKAPQTEWVNSADREYGISETIRREERSRAERVVRTARCHDREGQTDDFRPPSGLSARAQSRGYQESTESAARFSGQEDSAHVDLLQAVVEPRHCHQQTTSEEKFYKKSDRRGDVVEEGYDQALLSYSSQAQHYSHSAIV